MTLQKLGKLDGVETRLDNTNQWHLSKNLLALWRKTCLLINAHSTYLHD